MISICAAVSVAQLGVNTAVTLVEVEVALLVLEGLVDSGHRGLSLTVSGVLGTWFQLIVSSVVVDRMM
jgi:hypothetical protein